MNLIALPDGTAVPALGLGTWRMGESRASRAAEIAAVRTAIELGYRLIDTAEMYGEGGAEEVVGRAIADAVRAGDVRRDELFVVSKVYPPHATATGTALACDRSRRRLGLDSIDLYLLHWRGSVPLAETVDAMNARVAAGAIGRWGVSNFDVDDMAELLGVDGGAACATDQVWHSAAERGAEFALLPWLRRRAMPLMAYSPIDQGSLAGDAVLAGIGERSGLSAAQVALAWVLAQPGVVAIPKAVRVEHLRANLAAAEVSLDASARRAIDARFAPPRRKMPLAIN
ncbi:aldo/keto reductase [Piscinibacter koreensis]|uniref:Aldo/keto reductase n=1 Tax=Piscinibacter koreensis TaxID=2742824 RepID=A0A7Y6NPE6_9BURK|nr:aldo/keto reductase [Schlegelella koreensis]NUZ06864.1 aldo/keto reductase [Schlegelella koreensis]